MNLFDSKKKLGIAGVVMGLVAATLAYFGNPANMAICIACFVRDTAGALGLHSAEPVQYARPEIIGIVLGAFIISIATKEYRATAGSSTIVRFVLGMILVIGALVFLGCPLRMVIRMSAGDLNAWVALIGFVLGASTSYDRSACTCTWNKSFKEQYSRSGKYACTNHYFSDRWTSLWSICSEIKNVFRRKYP